MTNPPAADWAPCGLPASWSEFDSSTVTFNMTADCVFSNGNVNNNNIFLNFFGGEYTINGNGYSIIGPTNARTLAVHQFTATPAILHLNNITFRQSGFANGSSIHVYGGTLNGRNLIFRDGAGNLVLDAIQGGEAYLENVQFLNNRGTGTRPRVGGVAANSLISITNSVFRGNTNYEALAYTIGAGTLRLQGSRTLAGNSYTHPAPFQLVGDGGTLDIIAPPKRKKADPSPTPTSTPRPLAVTCPDVSAASGIAVHATFGLASGVQCQRLDGGGIGIQSIIDAGFIDAVDIWGYVDQGVEVCFPQIGRVLFLDARTMPRAIAPLEASIVNGMTCVAIDSPGSLVLLPE